MHITYAVKYFIQIVGSHAQKIYQWLQGCTLLLWEHGYANHTWIMLHFEMFFLFLLICYFHFHTVLTLLSWRRSCLCFHREALTEPRLWFSENPWCTGAGTRTETVRDREEKHKTLEEGERCQPYRDTHLTVLISKW